MTLLIDGKAHAAIIQRDVTDAVAALRTSRGVVPGLAVILVGQDPASEVYVRAKARHARACGFHTVQHRLSEDVSEHVLLATLAALNVAPEIHGILVQLPLPPHIDPRKVIEAIAPDKDIDGFTFINTGRMACGVTDGLLPCTPAGVMRLITAQLGPDLSGCNALVIGASNIVGRPMAELLLHAKATVTIAHDRTRNLPHLCAQADLIVVAIGQPRFIRGEWIRPGALIFDVGINRIPLQQGGANATRLVGDVDFDSAFGRAGAITPVPGGVGPMTIAMLLDNTLRACRRANGLADACA